MLITIINNIQEISLVHETLLTYMAKLPLDSEDQKISIAVDEILSNIIFMVLKIILSTILPFNLNILKAT